MVGEAIENTLCTHQWHATIAVRGKQVPGPRARVRRSISFGTTIVDYLRAETGTACRLLFLAAWLSAVEKT
jgi:hypothetical protein